MLFRITFPRALIVSFLWHLFCFFVFVIVIAPVSSSNRDFQAIVFLGSILDKTFLGPGAHKDYNPGQLHKTYLPGVGQKELKLPQISRASISRFHRFDKIAPYEKSISELIKEKSKLKPVYLRLADVKKEGIKTAALSSEVSARQVLYKPALPVISRTFQAGKAPSRDESFRIKLRFLVSPEGKVVFIEKVQSCGYPDIDMQAIRYLRKWEFMPLSEEGPKKDEEGVLVLELKAQ